MADLMKKNKALTKRLEKAITKYKKIKSSKATKLMTGYNIAMKNSMKDVIEKSQKTIEQLSIHL
jgi:hypothetical protein